MAKHDSHSAPDATPSGDPASSKTLWIVGLVALTLVAATVPVVVVLRSQATQPAVKVVERKIELADAMAALEEDDLPRARRLAKQLRRNVAPAQGGGPAYVLGAASSIEADEYLGRERDELLLLAASYLQEAHQLGFPEECQSDGLYLYGKSLNLTGRYQESRAPLEEALRLAEDQDASLHWLLAIAYGRGEQPDLEKALEHINTYLADDELETADRTAGLLEQLRLLFEADDFAGCQKALAQIPRDSSQFAESQLIRGRIELRIGQRLKSELEPDASAEARQLVRAKFEDAIHILRRAQDDPLGSHAIRRSMYLIGVCYLGMEDYSAALAQFERTRKVWLDTPEGQISALEEADLLRRSGHIEEALQAYQRVLGAVRNPFVNEWIAPESFRGRVLAAYRQFVQEGEFERAVLLCESLAPLFSPARAAEYGADALRAWSVKLAADADSLTEPESTTMRLKARSLMRKAGREFAELAKLEFTTRQYPDDLWRSAESLLDGHDFRAAATTFEDYLKHESRRRRPRALINLGECYLAMNRLDESLAVCQECIEFYPTDAASYQARIISSKVYVEKGDYKAAENTLRENLNGEFLAPESKEWRESLFRLGELLQASGRYEEAIQRLREAVERYSESNEAVRARYLIAESYRQLAKQIQDKLLKEANETTRIAQQKELQTQLTQAILYYKQVQDALNRRQDRTRLTTLEKMVLRNSFFAEGAAWFELGRYENAIRAYSTITSRYQHDPESLEAFVQIASCYRRTNKPVEARGTIQHAKVVLSRMDPDAPFAKVTNSTRREWLDFLEWLGTL